MLSGLLRPIFHGGCFCLFIFIFIQLGADLWTRRHTIQGDKEVYQSVTGEMALFLLIFEVKWCGGVQPKINWNKILRNPETILLWSEYIVFITTETNPITPVTVPLILSLLLTGQISFISMKCVRTALLHPFLCNKNFNRRINKTISVLRSFGRESSSLFAVCLRSTLHRYILAVYCAVNGWVIFIYRYMDIAFSKRPTCNLEWSV